jgi:hypothetical protein
VSQGSLSEGQHRCPILGGVKNRKESPLPSMNPTRYALAGVAALVLAAGGYAIGSSSGDNSSAAPGNGQLPHNVQVPRGGQGRPGFGAPATGAAADKAKAAALAKYKGTAERVIKLSDGSYLVHVIGSNGEYRVAVSKDFKVTGAQQGGPGGPGGLRGPGGPRGAGGPGNVPQN